MWRGRRAKALRESLRQFGPEIDRRRMIGQRDRRSNPRCIADARYERGGRRVPKQELKRGGGDRHGMRIADPFDRLQVPDDEGR